MLNRIPPDGAKGRSLSDRSFVVACSLTLVSILAASTSGVFAASDTRTITLEERIAAQTAIEAVRWSHRLWPEGAETAKPSLSAVMPYDAIRAKVEDSLRKSNALEQISHRPITARQLQAELDRMTRASRDTGMLREIYAALSDDPFLIAECLARPALAERLIRSWHGGDADLPRDTVTAAAGTVSAADADVVPFDAWWAATSPTLTLDLVPPATSYSLTLPEAAPCTPDTWRPTATPFVPGVRGDHTAVWTGSEMIVWGGVAPGPRSNCDNRPYCYQDTGYRYDPSTDTWSPTSTGANVPAPRTSHSAVWTGTEMIVWGGSTEPGSASNGARYDPLGDTWNPVTTIGAPVGGMAFWTGNRMIVLGGSVPIIGASYDPVSDEWTSISPAPTQAGYLGSVVWTGKELITWGDGPQGTPGVGARYDPTTDLWTLTATLGAPEARSKQVAVWTGTRMIVWGGNNLPLVSDYFNGASYDPVTDTWSDIAPAPDGSYSGYYTTRAAWTGSRMVVIHSIDAFMAWMNTYDPSKDLWEVVPMSTEWPAIGEGFSMIWTGTEVIVWGCLGDTTFRNAGGRYDPVTDEWVRTGNGYSLLGPRTGHTAVWTGSEMIILGGVIDVNTPGWPEPYHGHLYDPATDTWRPTAVSAAFDDDRAYHTAVWTGTEMIVWGGISLTNTGGRYNPMTDTWVPTTVVGAPRARQDHTAVWTGRYMIVWGGLNGIDRLSTGGVYNPSADRWRPMSTGINSPSARSGHTSVWTGSEMIVWGGNTAFDVYTDTGARYDPRFDTWKPIALSGSTPAARGKHSAVWTGKFMIVWGGKNAAGALGTGGIYSPGRDMWRPTGTGINAPSPRESHSSVWTGSEMIVWGGSDGSAYFDDGARYTPVGDKWLPMASTGGTIPARSGQTAVTTGSEMIVWGGFPFTNTGGAYCYAP